ncbi:ABC transporter ATP-binding protein [Pseudoleptotrichia goodfellowii]|jgi:ABC-type dipeptide/oligopeptide/nickel transport system, ATPase component|uniref:ABC transporter, ATP-binding protein n=1 Tax=Pseudoleptotrichia goodfellowii F0264 TaxID=596323 RepID=D0GLM6_9FUSO|nr:ABC transporter ATP-binding protein [Pseudoleptotrichia goodfellowii]EEY34989.1 ABC transporter, ATP-binding protein [Pseudoleptotrichia goodfellowii F0264]
MTDNIILEVKNLVVSTVNENKKNTILDNVSFTLEKGERLGVIGDSGTGKSVLMLSLTGLLPKNNFEVTGEILYKGKTDLLKFDRKNMRKFTSEKINMILQDSMNILNPYRKISDQITETLIFKEKISKKEAYKKAVKILKDLNISAAEKRIKDYPYQFSGGMKQRIGIALSLLGKADILIADEPTTSLDAINQEKILDKINRHIKENNISLIYISHDMRVISKMSDRIIVMEKGKIIKEKLAVDL